MVAKTKQVSQGIGSVDIKPILDSLSKSIAKDIYYSIVLSKGIVEIKSGKSISGKKIDKFFESILD